MNSVLRNAVHAIYLKCDKHARNASEQAETNGFFTLKYDDHSDSNWQLLVRKITSLIGKKP